MDEEFKNHAELSEKSWSRVINSATKAGYREGIEEGKQFIFQKGFDMGYAEGFETAFMLGKYKGVATATTGNEQQGLSSIDKILEKTRRGACHVCIEESKKIKDKTDDDIHEPLLEDVIKEQRIHSAEVLGTLRQHFAVLLKERGVCIDRITL